MSFKNFSYSLVATAPSPATSGVSLTVTATQGSRFPTVPFPAVVWPAGEIPLVTNAEVVQVTARVGDVLTITRAQESSTARTIVVGDQIAATLTKSVMDGLQNRILELEGTVTDFETRIAALEEAGGSALSHNVRQVIVSAAFSNLETKNFTISPALDDYTKAVITYPGQDVQFTLASGGMGTRMKITSNTNLQVKNMIDEATTLDVVVHVVEFDVP